MCIQEYLGLRDNRAFSMLVASGFSAILVGAILIIVGILVINSTGDIVSPTLGKSTIMNKTYKRVLISVGQAFIVAGVSLVVVGAAVIIAILFGIVGESVELR